MFSFKVIQGIGLREAATIIRLCLLFLSSFQDKALFFRLDYKNKQTKTIPYGSINYLCVFSCKNSLFKHFQMRHADVNMTAFVHVN